MQKQLDLNINQPIHIIGGGGVGMSALAMLLAHLGFSVTASDKNGGPYLDKLSEKGLTVWTGSDPEKIPAQALVFYSTAVPDSDPERLYAASKGLGVFSRHILIEALTRQYYTIAVSGTHGKTTTTAWMAYLLELAGFDPNAMIGGTLVQWTSNVRLGKGQINGKPVLVMEADESDGSFLSICASETVITNIELDHVDHYSGLSQLQEKFELFLDNCHKNNGVFFPSYETRHLLKAGLNSAKKVQEITSLISLRPKDHALCLKNNGHDAHKADQAEEEIFPVSLSGLHNLWNAFAVLTFGLYHGIALGVIRQALSGFKGVERRMQLLLSLTAKTGAKVTVTDDYAHHPTEVKMVLNTLLAANTNQKLLVVWEPHRVSRLLHFNKDFTDLFLAIWGRQEKWPDLFLLDVFDAAGEKGRPEFARFTECWRWWLEKSAALIHSSGSDRYLPLMERIRQELAQEEGHGEIQKKDINIVFLGAGHSSDIAKDFAAYIKDFLK